MQRLQRPGRLSVVLALAVIAQQADAGTLSRLVFRTGPTIVANDPGGAGSTEIAVGIRPDAQPDWLSPWGTVSYELSAGHLVRADPPETRVNVARAGLVWRQRPELLGPDGFTEFGPGWAVRSENRVNGADQGGTHFLSIQATLGMHFGPRRRGRLGLRWQHTSNAGSNTPNPGINLLLLEFGYRLGAAGGADATALPASPLSHPP